MEPCDQQSLSELVPLLVQYSRNAKRGPYGAGKAFQDAKQAGRDSTPRIFLEQSESAWRAYFAGKKATETQHGFTGKARLTTLFNELDARSSDEKRAIAAQLDFALNNEAATETEEAMEVEAAEENNANVSHGAKRRRTGSHNEPEIPSATTTNSADTETPQYESNQIHSQLQDVYVGAPLEPAKGLFQEQFWDSILRIPSRNQPGRWMADISMIFQQGDVREHFGCQMDIGIEPEKVAGLALEYFGAQIEIKHGVRLVRLQGGGLIEPDPSINLRSGLQNLSGILLDELYDAACTSPIYQHEKTQLRSRTDGISMTISNKANDGAKFTVFLAEWRAGRLKTRLYG